MISETLYSEGYISIADAWERYRVSSTTIYKWRKAGLIKVRELKGVQVRNWILETELKSLIGLD